MDWKDLAGTVSGLAPTIGGAIGGPAGAAVGLAVSALLRVFGLKSDAKPEELSNAIHTDPETKLKLIAAENAFQLELRKQDVEEIRARLGDVQDARAREVAITKATGRREWNQYLTAWVVIAGFFLLCYYLMKVTLPPGSNEVVFMLFGALATGFGTVLNYFFGSSKGSAEKNVLLAGK